MEFDFVNELDTFDNASKFAINIVQITEDGSFTYIRRSNQNETKPPKYINLYENHFSYLTDVMKLARSYVCEKCGSRFKRNSELEIHIPNIGQPKKRCLQSQMKQYGVRMIKMIKIDK